MKDKLFKLLGDFVLFFVGLVSEAGGLSKLTFRTVVVKLLSSRLWVAAGALMAIVAYDRLGIPEDSVVAFWSSVAAIALGYMGANTVTKAKEIGSAPNDPS